MFELASCPEILKETDWSVAKANIKKEFKSIIMRKEERKSVLKWLSWLIIQKFLSFIYLDKLSDPTFKKIFQTRRTVLPNFYSLLMYIE